jgi:hypothetical protein
VFGDGSTSLRGGYGLAYERNFGNVTFNVIQNPPNYATLSIIAGSTPGFTTIPIASTNFGPVGGTSGTLALLPATLCAVNPDISTAYAHTWSAAVERQLTRSSIVSLEYSGSAGRDLYSISNINRIVLGAAYIELHDEARAADALGNYLRLAPKANDAPRIREIIERLRRQVSTGQS